MFCHDKLQQAIDDFHQKDFRNDEQKEEDKDGSWAEADDDASNDMALKSDSNVISCQDSGCWAQYRIRKYIYINIIFK